MQRFCHRALLLERGSPVYLGEPGVVADRYLEIDFGRDPDAAATRPRRGRRRRGPGASRHGSRTSGASASPLSSRASGCRCAPGSRSWSRSRDPAASVYVLNEEHKAIVVANTETERERTGNFAAGEEAVFSFGFENVLAPGRYSPVITLAHRGLRARRDGPVRGGFLVRCDRGRAAGRDDRPADATSGSRRVIPASRGRAARRRECGEPPPRPPRAAGCPYEALGRPIKGPRRAQRRLARFWHLTYNIARHAVEAALFGSALGYVWQLVRPLLLFTVLYVFFTVDLEGRRVGAGPGGRVLRHAAAGLDRAVHVLHRGHDRLGAQRRRQRDAWCARSSSRAW